MLGIRGSVNIPYLQQNSRMPKMNATLRRQRRQRLQRGGCVEHQPHSLFELVICSPITSSCPSN